MKKNIKYPCEHCGKEHDLKYDPSVWSIISFRCECGMPIYVDTMSSEFKKAKKGRLEKDN